MISLTKDYYEYLKDESRKAGKADSISFPCSEEEIIDMIVSLNKNNTKVTIQGARTGITAGAVPQEGHILNLKKMSKITGLRYENGYFFFQYNPVYCSLMSGKLQQKKILIHLIGHKNQLRLSRKCKHQEISFSLLTQLKQLLP